MLKNVLAVAAGFLGGAIVVFLFERLGHYLFPLPPGLDLTRPEAIAEYVKTASAGALSFALLAQAAGFIAGGLLTSLLAGARSRRAVLSYGVLALAVSLLNLWQIPHTLWFAALAVLLPLPLAWLDQFAIVCTGKGGVGSLPAPALLLCGRG